MNEGVYFTQPNRLIWKYITAKKGYRMHTWAVPYTRDTVPAQHDDEHDRDQMMYLVSRQPSTAWDKHEDYRFTLKKEIHPRKTENSGGITTNYSAPNKSLMALKRKLTEICQLRLTAGREVGPKVNVSVEIFGNTSAQYYQCKAVQHIWTKRALHSPRTQKKLRQVEYIFHTARTYTKKVETGSTAKCPIAEKATKKLRAAQRKS